MPRRRRVRKSIAFKAAELAFAVPQVIARRWTQMAASGAATSARDRSEWHLMGAEKLAAFTESWNAMALHAFRENQRLALAAMMRFWFPWLGGKPALRSTSRRLRHAAGRVVEKGMAPVHRRAVANARRLGKSR